MSLGTQHLARLVRVAAIAALLSVLGVLLACTGTTSPTPLVSPPADGDATSLPTEPAAPPLSSPAVPLQPVSTPAPTAPESTPTDVAPTERPTRSYQVTPVPPPALSIDIPEDEFAWETDGFWPGLSALQLGRAIYSTFGSVLGGIDIPTGEIVCEHDAEVQPYIFPYDRELTAGNGIIYESGSRLDGHYIYALMAETCEEKWIREIPDVGPDSSMAGMTLADGSLYVGVGVQFGYGPRDIPADERYLFAFESESGELLWRYQTEDTIWGAPVEHNGVVYTTTRSSSSDGQMTIIALDSVSGRPIWAERANSSACHLALNAGVLYLCGIRQVDDPYLYAVDALTGQRLWSYETGGWYGYGAKDVLGFSGETMYVATAFGQLIALEAYSGLRLWEYAAEGDFWPAWAYAFSNGVFYHHSKGNYVSALNLDNGETLWNYETYSLPAAISGVVEDIVYVGTEEGSAYAIDAATGEALWRYWNSYAAYDEKVVVGHFEGVVLFANGYAIDTRKIRGQQ